MEVCKRVALASPLRGSAPFRGDRLPKLGGRGRSRVLALVGWVFRTKNSINFV